MAQSKGPQVTSVVVVFVVTLITVVGPTTAAFSQDSFTRARRATAQKANRYGDVPLGAVIRTDERYNNGGLFKGPRGWDYWNYLENPKPYQNPNLWPDKRPTYFFGQLTMPAGSSLTIRGRFPFARYFKFSLYQFERQTFVAVAGGSLAGYDIEPDAGSENPYRVGADRLVKKRNFTIYVFAHDAPKNPADRAKNTVYVGRQGKELMAGFRIYLSDEGYDGAGWGPGAVPSPDGPGVTYEGKLADGTVLSAEEVVKRFSRPMGAAPPPLTVDQWYGLVDAKDNDPALTPATAPARPDPKWEMFRGMRYSVVGAFKTPEQQAKLPLQKEMEGGGDPTTAYMVAYLSRKFGPIYVFRAKMPTFPNTFAGTKIMPDGQIKYWSVVSVASAPSGELWDGLTDMMLPLDEQGYYTIAVSRPEDRPKNAIAENRVAWMDWGPGEGLDDPRNRKDLGMLIMRFMVCHSDWENSPERATKPGSEEAVMGAYYPRGYYTTKEQFEAQGVKK
jgi:hypothetical protein